MILSFTLVCTTFYSKSAEPLGRVPFEIVVELFSYLYWKDLTNFALGKFRTNINN